LTPGQSGPVCRKRPCRPSEVVAKWVSTAAHQDHSRPADENRDGSIGKAGRQAGRLADWGTREPLTLAGGSCPRLLQGIVEHKDAKVDASRVSQWRGLGIPRFHGQDGAIHDESVSLSTIRESEGLPVGIRVRGSPASSFGGLQLHGMDGWTWDFGWWCGNRDTDRDGGR
jgi:hypothetical protein